MDSLAKSILSILFVVSFLYCCVGIVSSVIAAIFVDHHLWVPLSAGAAGWVAWALNKVSKEVL